MSTKTQTRPQTQVPAFTKTIETLAKPVSNRMVKSLVHIAIGLVAYRVAQSAAKIAIHQVTTGILG